MPKLQAIAQLRLVGVAIYPFAGWPSIWTVCDCFQWLLQHQGTTAVDTPPSVLQQTAPNLPQPHDIGAISLTDAKQRGSLA